MNSLQQSTPNDSGGTGSSMNDTWQKRPNSDQIPCPALMSFYNHGWLVPDEHGNVSLSHLDDVLARAGISARIRKVLEKGAEKTDDIPNSFNLFALRNSSLDHSGSTSVRDPEVNPEKLESALLQFGKDGRMYAEHFAAAASHAAQQDPGIKGTLTQTVELTSVLEVFGRVDESNRRYLTNEDVQGLWIDGRFPKDWHPRASAEIDGIQLLGGVTKMLFQRGLKAIGF